MIAVLVAHALVSTKRIKGDAISYQALNLVGAVLILVNLLVYGAYPSVGVNVIWIGIAVLTIIRSVVTTKYE